MTRLPDFRLETYFSRWEFAARHHMTASDVQTMTLTELLALADDQDRTALENLSLGYTETYGDPALREMIAQMYERAETADVICFAGAEEALYLAMNVLLDAGDHAVVLTPNYQAAETVPLALCEVTGVALDPDRDWALDLDQIKAAIRPNTRVVSVGAELLDSFRAEVYDCHVKAGWVTGAPDFIVKIATGFYRNPAAGLPSNHGLVCVISARTGQVQAILDDQGLLTAWRTAAAGALITHAMARPSATTLAVFGTGEQARLQVEWLARLRPISTVLVHGRSEDKARVLCEEFNARGQHARPASAEEAAGADMVITTTPASAPVLEAAHVRSGAHVTGIGTDMPHKNEPPRRSSAVRH